MARYWYKSADSPWNSEEFALLDDRDDSPAQKSFARQAMVRNLIGFWILGLCNNYAYVVMLSAAYDILSDEYKEGHHSNSSSNSTDEGNPTSTGAVLLADILPALAIKMVAPFFMQHTHLRVMLVVLLSSMSFVITSISYSDWLSYIGVICASLSSGLGEVTFLAYSSYFDKNVVSTWSSGTGGAGVVGALSYASLTSALSPRTTLQVMLVFPCILAACFWLLIVHPPATQFHSCLPCSKSEERLNVLNADSGLDMLVLPPARHSTRYKLTLIKPLVKYMVPLSTVYFAEYFINQGLLDIIYFKNAWLDRKQQYRWFQVDYQVGVLLSRSSVNLFQLKKVWLMSVLQVINAVFLLCETVYTFLPSIWIMLGIVLFEGLLGGCAYVNTFYRVSQEIPEEHREFSMSVTSLADSFGIGLAGAIAVPVHNLLRKASS